MTPELFKEIRNYLTERRFNGQKWTLERTAKEMLRNVRTIQGYEAGEQEIPDNVAERMHELKAQAMLLELNEIIFDILLNKVERPADLEAFKEKLRK